MLRQRIEIHDRGHAVGIEMPFVDLKLGIADRARVDAADAGLGRHPRREPELVGGEIVQPAPANFGCALHADARNPDFAPHGIEQIPANGSTMFILKLRNCVVKRRL